MRRVLTAFAALTLLAATGPGPRPLLANPCPDYCGEKAAAHCGDIDSLKCAWYIMGCLAGCNLSRL